MTTDGNSWLIGSGAGHNSRLRLICFPYAGGGASAFRAWRSGLPAEIDVRAVQLPGREGRFREPLLVRLEEAAAAVDAAIDGLPDLPMAFYGHSMGAVLAFEVARRRVARHAREPGLLVVGGRAAPTVASRAPPMHGLGDEAFLDGLRRLGGTPEEVLADAELMQLLLPVLRADFALIETHRHRPTPLLSAPVLALGGQDDPDTPTESLEAWSRLTTGPCRVRLLPGGHFFLASARDQLLGLLAEALAPLLRPSPTQFQGVAPDVR